MNFDEDEDFYPIPDENIDFESVYALHNFQATVEGQVNVERDDKLKLLDDSNSYWWLVKVLKCGAVGYIPAESIEIPHERLARLNRHRNVNLASSINNKKEDYLKKERKGQGKFVSFNSPLYIIAEGPLDYFDDADDSSLDYSEDDESYENDTEATTEYAQNHEKAEDSDDMVESLTSNYENSDTRQGRSPKFDEASSEENQHQILEGDSPRYSQDMQPTDQQHFDQLSHKQNFEPVASPILQRSEFTHDEKMKQSNVYTNGQNNPASNIPSNITQVINRPGETIKTSLTPTLGSDFMDFSDDEEEELQSDGKLTKLLGNDPAKTRMSFEEFIKSEERDEKKGGKSKKEEKKKEGGRFMNFFKRKSKKKEEESPKQLVSVSSTFGNNKAKPTNVQADPQYQRKGSLTTQQRNQAQTQMQVDPHSRRQVPQQVQPKMQTSVRLPLQQGS
ncbi:1566_t:CDS:2, partial [Acaulospora morrowiae]